MIVAVFIDGNKLDLFEDENISLTSSVLDVQDISVNTTDYSQTFTVPASSRNNRIFKHYYNDDIDNPFDARTSVPGRIELSGMTFRSGKILLQKATIKSGVISNYTIYFLGSLVSIKDILGNFKLADLNLSALTLTYNSTNVATLLQTSASYAPIIYTLLAKKQYYYNSSLSDEVMTSTVANIHYKSGTANGVLWNELIPSLAIYKIIEAINTDFAGITFSNDFFGTNEFKRLYLWLNNSITNNIGGETKQVEFTGGDTDYVSLASSIGTFITNGNIGAPGSNWFNLVFTVTPDVGYNNVQFIIRCYEGSVLLQQKTWQGSATDMSIDLTSFNYGGDSHTWNIHYEVESKGDFNYTCNLKQTHYDVSTPTEYNTTGLGTLLSYMVVSQNIPDIKIIDFLKGIFQAFKLVVIPKQDGTIYVDTIENYLASGKVIDLTRYVDNESIEVSRGDILNTIKYKFQKPTTILNKQFDENNLKGYGDEESELTDESGNPLEGGSIEIELPFEQIVYEKLYDENAVDTIELMYGAIIDDKLAPVNPKPHIFYNQQYAVGGDGIGLITGESTKDQITGAINTASHVIDDTNPTYSFVFSQEINEFTGQLIENTLYSNYHKNYIDGIFNVKRRNYSVKCKYLPVQILLKLALNDVVKIGYSYFRINKFTTDLTTGKTEFELVNALTNNLATIAPVLPYSLPTYPVDSIILDYSGLGLSSSEVDDLLNALYATGYATNCVIDVSGNSVPTGASSSSRTGLESAGNTLILDSV